MKLRQTPLPTALEQQFRDNPYVEQLRRYQSGERTQYSILVGYEDIGRGAKDLRWHISVAHRQHLPAWEHLVEIAHELRPGVVFVVGIPPRSHWMNVHPNCLHLWSMKDDALAHQWMEERQGHTPTAGGVAR